MPASSPTIRRLWKPPTRQAPGSPPARGRKLPGLHFLETRTAQNRPALRWPERDRGFYSARRAMRPGFRPYPGTPVGALRLALLAALGVIFEVFVVEEQLLTCGEDEFR